RNKMKTIRDRFYEFDADAHNSGYATLTAPIFDHSEELQAALTIVMTRRGESVSTNGSGMQYLKQLKETALEISRTLGSIEMA
ncbi:MAG: hypothetical protein GTO41_28480, partial [Burkholderiales bacterium]|nr:hypothetical protein [Burkholderiales bacterium]